METTKELPDWAIKHIKDAGWEGEEVIHWKGDEGSHLITFASGAVLIMGRIIGENKKEKEMKTKEDLIELADEELDEAIENCYLGKLATFQDNVLRTKLAYSNALKTLEEFKARNPMDVYTESLDVNCVTACNGSSYRI